MEFRKRIVVVVVRGPEILLLQHDQGEERTWRLPIFEGESNVAASINSGENVKLLGRFKNKREEEEEEAYVFLVSIWGCESLYGLKVWKTFPEILEMIRSGEIIDGATLSALMKWYAKTERGEK